MEWLIAIVCVILVVVFWRIFLPLALVVGAIGIGVFLVSHHSQTAREEARRIESSAKQGRIAKAKNAATSEGKSWEVRFRMDPASGEKIARASQVYSNDSLCRLHVEQRLNGVKLTSIFCREYTIDAETYTGTNIEVKFSGADTSQRMEIRQFTDSDDAYIPEEQGSGRMSYADFIAGLKTNKAVAIRLPIDDYTSGKTWADAIPVWMTFSLEGSRVAIDALGKKEAEAQRLKAEYEQEAERVRLKNEAAKAALRMQAEARQARARLKQAQQQTAAYPPLPVRKPKGSDD